MRFKTFTFILTTLLASNLAMATMPNTLEHDGPINLVDAEGQRTGLWYLTGAEFPDFGYHPYQLVEKGTYIAGKKAGQWTAYHENENVRHIITYAAGEPEGPYELYDELGELTEVGVWSDGKNIGEFRRFHSNGILSQQFSFAENGLRNGTQYYYHDNGTLAMKVEMVNGIKNGHMSRYDMRGYMQQLALFEDGDLVKEFGSDTSILNETERINNSDNDTGAIRSNSHTNDLSKTRGQLSSSHAPVR